MEILEQLARKGFTVFSGERRLLAQLASGQAAFVKDTSGHSYRVTIDTQLVSVESVEGDKITTPCIALVGPATGKLTALTSLLSAETGARVASLERYYEVQLSPAKNTVWIHSSCGSTVGRFGRMGIDLHTTVAEQLAGAPECRYCTHGKPTAEDWATFRRLATEYWGVEVPFDAFDPALLATDGAQ